MKKLSHFTICVALLTAAGFALGHNGREQTAPKPVTPPAAVTAPAETPPPPRPEAFDESTLDAAVFEDAYDTVHEAYDEEDLALSGATWQELELEELTRRIAWDYFGGDTDHEAMPKDLARRYEEWRAWAHP